MIETHEVAPWIERLARVGYVAKALLYGTTGALAALAAFSSGGRATDTRGAMGTLLGAPMGRALLAAMALGLLGYALWGLVEGALDPERRGSDVKALAVRASFIVCGLAHGLLALTAAKLALGKPSSDDERDRAGILRSPRYRLRRPTRSIRRPGARTPPASPALPSRR